jgi:uncharacterized GH25 family protein
MRTLILALIVLMSACTNKAHEVWMATKDTPVYASESIIFTLAVGDTCTAVRDVVMKSYLHTEIQCKKGRGWVVDKQNFDIKSIH